MYDLQSLIFRYAAHWSEMTSLTILAIGLLFSLQGFRFARFLLPAVCGAGGFLIGVVVAGIAGLPAVAAVLFAGGFGLGSLFYFRFGLIASSAISFGVLMQYLGYQCGARSNMSLLIGLVGVAFGIAMFWLYRRQLAMLVTILVGSGLLVTSFVGLATALEPSLGGTFIDWADRLPFMIPVLLIMLWTLGYSVQANARQGEMQAGGSPDVRELESL